MSRIWIGEGSSGAIFSDCRKYRYTLWRRWGLFGRQSNHPEFVDEADMVAFIGLNPSTADERIDDPTIRRCIGFAKQWGFGGMVMLNAFAYRATDPKVMKEQAEPIGEWNDEAIHAVTRLCGKVICCWGNHGTWMNRNERLHEILPNLACHLGQTKTYQPKHPLYLSSNTEPSDIWF